MIFTDTQFLTAKEKQLVYKDWVRFLDALIADTGNSTIDRYGNDIPLLFRKFTKRLYNHLHQHCGYIAHYNQWGFFCTYFQGGDDIASFIEAFKDDRYPLEDYIDINGAMLKELGTREKAILNKANNEQRETDILQAKALLAKHGMTGGDI